MTTRDDILQRWQTGLEVNQPTAGPGASQLAWMHRLYVRVYDFLLSCYRHVDWRTQPEDESSAPVELFAPPMSEMAGRPAKSVGQIAKVLKTVHCANAETTAQRDARPRVVPCKADWIIAAEFHYRRQAILFHRLLRRCGILSRNIRLGRHFFIEVRRFDLDGALSVFQQSRERLCLKAECRRRVARRSNSGPVFAWFIVYVLVAASLSAIVSAWVVRTGESLNLVTIAFVPWAFACVMVAGLLVAVAVWIGLMKQLRQKSTTR